MNTVILIFLIINTLFFSIVVFGLISEIVNFKTKNIKKIGELEYKLEKTKLDCVDLEKKCKLLSIRKQQSSKYKLSQKVLALTSMAGYKTLKSGQITQIRVSLDKVEYEVEFEEITLPLKQVFNEKDIFPDVTKK